MRIVKLLIPFFVFFAYSCKKDTPMATNNPQQHTYLALGDSYTIGESVDPGERFPVILVNELNKSNILFQEPTIIAVTGWTTANLKTGIANANIEGRKYDLVSLLIGVNNYYQGRNIEEYKIQFKELLLKSIEFAGGNKDKVFVVSIPDYGYTPFGESNKAVISAGIDSFNSANKQISDSIGIKYFNITPISRKGLDDPSLVANDGLHPSGKQYKEWVDWIKEDVIKMVK